eukprot:s3994_g10.t1
MNFFCLLKAVLICVIHSDQKIVGKDQQHNKEENQATACFCQKGIGATSPGFRAFEYGENPDIDCETHSTSFSRLHFQFFCGKKPSQVEHGESRALEVHILPEDCESQRGTLSNRQVALDRDSSGKDAELEQARQDLVVTVQKHFPDPATMPSDVKSSLERYGALLNKKVTKDMHKETKNMDKARTAMSELRKAKDSHKRAWILHITEAAEAWRVQMQEYQTQQADYTRKLAQAQADLESAQKAISTLTSRAGTAATTAQLKAEPLEDPGEDKEEKEACRKVQEILTECATLITVESDEVMYLISEDEAEGPERKRARSIEKGITPSRGGDSSLFGST